ncbi:MAG: 16S rRNA (uracil1498-N3)-methyltransferase [Candidatus Paceibacteria bacterium]|jgi:16S rRNA (uracil1498-N3)-methyltransferase
MSRLHTFLLETTPEQGVPELITSDREHALKVLRLKAGTRILGVDGRGKCWELEVKAAGRRQLELAHTGPARVEPPPGSAGASLPWLEVCTPLPKGNRAESLFSQLTQLGLARLVPLVTEHSEAQARELPDSRKERMIRAGQEAIKQCGSLWLPEIAHPETLASLLKKPACRVVLDPLAESSFSSVLAGVDSPSEFTPESPFQLILGPEGGLSASEIELMVQNGSIRACISPHVLRIENAALAGLGIAAEAWMKIP